jgi:hypothetical protein
MNKTSKSFEIGDLVEVNLKEHYSPWTMPTLSGKKNGSLALVLGINSGSRSMTVSSTDNIGKFSNEHVQEYITFSDDIFVMFLEDNMSMWVSPKRLNKVEIKS